MPSITTGVPARRTWRIRQAETRKLVRRCRYLAKLRSNASADEDMDTDSDDPTLEDQLGFFGTVHIDGKDGLGYLSAMNCLLLMLLHLIDPGVFYLPSYGVCFQLDFLTVVVFEGLEWHGGCLPKILERACRMPNLPRNMVRLIGILYPMSSATDMYGRMALAALPDGEILHIGPEMLHQLESVSYSSLSTFGLYSTVTAYMLIPVGPQRLQKQTMLRMVAQ